MPTINSEVTRVEVGYFGAALVLCILLSGVYRLGPASSSSASSSSATSPAASP
jgi:hypothetical protein